MKDMITIQGLLAMSLALLLCNQVNAEIIPRGRNLTIVWTLPQSEAHHYHSKFITLGQRLFTDEDPSISFLTCQYQPPEQQYLCNYKKESSPLDNMIIMADIENINITDDGHDKWGFNSELWHLDTDKIIIISHDRMKNLTHGDTRVLILDIYLDAIIANYTFPAFVMERNILAGYRLLIYRNFFEIILSDKDMCEDQLPSCRITYGLDGQRIGDPEPHEAQNTFVALPVSYKVPDKGYYALGRDLQTTDSDKSTWVVSYVNTRGQAKELLPKLQLSFGKKGSYSFSNHEELFGICWMELDSSAVQSDNDVISSRKIRCVQFDTQGLMMNVTMNLPHNATWLTARNVPGGDLLVATENCDAASNCTGFRVQRFGATVQGGYDAVDLDGPRTRFNNKLDFDAQITLDYNNRRFCISWNWVADTYEHTDLNFGSSCVPWGNTKMQQKNEVL